MKVKPTSLDGVMIVEPDVHEDNRGFFMETFHAKRYREAGVDVAFVQDNLSFSVQGTLRGLHYQYPHAQAKLVQVIKGEIFDVAVDIRRGSPSFGRWTGVYLNDKNKHQLFIPEGFAHGFCVLSDKALFMYKCSEYYAPKCEGGVLWSDPELGIDWPLENPLISERDAKFLCLKDMALETLPP
jgi:dTDP-4-dehydrorhamnose 3,5-epimerase